MSGKVFISMADKYKADAVGIAKQLTDMGYGVVATRGTANTLMAAGGDKLAGFFCVTMVGTVGHEHGWHTWKLLSSARSCSSLPIL